MDNGRYYDDKKNSNNTRKPLIRWRRIRYRDPIWGLSPETWLAISFTLLVLGVSMLNAGSLVEDGSKRDRNIVYKTGAFLVFVGWATLVFLIEKIKSRNGRRPVYIRAPHTPFMNMSIPPSTRQEWLSAVLLPPVERGWVAVESEPWFEPGHEIAQPPTPATAEKDGEETKSSATKKKRIRKKKTNIQVPESDEMERSSEIPAHIDDLEAIISAELPGDPNPEDQQPQSSVEIDAIKNISHAPGGDMMEDSVLDSGQQKDSQQTPSPAIDSNQTSVDDISSSQTSDQTERPHATCCQSRESQQTSEQQKNEMPTQSNDSNQDNFDKPEQSVQILDHSQETKEGPGRTQPVQSNLASNLNFQQSTRKKRNRRRKK